MVLMVLVYILFNIDLFKLSFDFDLKLVNYMEKLEKETIGFKIYCKKNN
jgi:hypothetical protein